MFKDKKANRHLKFLWFVHACGPDTGYAFKLYSNYSDIEEVYNATDYDDYVKIPDAALKRLLDKRLDAVFEITKKCALMGIWLLCIEDDAYPDKLKKIKDPPLLLFYKGQLSNLDKLLCVGMVGTRKMSDYGAKTAEYLASGLADSGVCIISGLAKGIDCVCQRTTLNNGGYTVGVVGNSIDTVYPKENAALFNLVYRYGAVIGEYWPGCNTTKNSFPRRNRIIAGLSDTVVVVEAPAGSGALITAAHAKAQGKPVCVPPMPLTKENVGTASLLKGGARMINSVSDILDEYASVLPHTIPPDAPLPSIKDTEPDPAVGDKAFGRAEKEHAYNFLLEELTNNGPETLWDAAMASKRYSIREIMRAATALEVDGFIERHAGGFYYAVPADKVPEAIILKEQDKE